MFTWESCKRTTRSQNKELPSLSRETKCFTSKIRDNSVSYTLNFRKFLYRTKTFVPTLSNEKTTEADAHQSHGWALQCLHFETSHRRTYIAPFSRARQAWAKIIWTVSVIFVFESATSKVLATHCKSIALFYKTWISKDIRAIRAFFATRPNESDPRFGGISISDTLKGDFPKPERLFCNYFSPLPKLLTTSRGWRVWGGFW